MKFKLFLRGNYSLDAIAHFLNIVKEGAKTTFDIEPEVVHSVKDIHNGDVVFVIDAKSHFFVWMKYPKNKVISWFQGILPEENRLLNPNSSLVNKIRIKWWEFLEQFSLKNSVCNLFVSDRMYLHYHNKYGYTKSNYLVIPCYNQHLDTNSITKSDRYLRPTFVYAGSLADWQCINETLMLFKTIKSHITNAELTLYTNEFDKAKSLIGFYSLVDVNVDYVPYDQINDRLKNFKYGFLIRKDHIVNRVATPTKMNTYLANGVIPIYSNVIDAFIENIKTDFRIVVNDNIDEDCRQVVAFENRNVDSYHLVREYTQLFDSYYSDSRYIKEIQTTRFFLR